MKNILILFCLASIVLNVSALHAQNNMIFGIKAGLNISTFGGSELESESRVGFMGGISIDAELEMLPFLVESGIFYSQKGPKGEYGSGLLPGGNFGNAGNFKLEYLEVPVMAKYNIDVEGKLQPNLLLGPYVGFNVGSKVEEGNSGGQIGGL